jgi:hypothetical protein
MKKQRKQIIFWGDAGKLLLDLGKLAVGGVIIGGILRGGVPPAILIVSGSAAAFVCFILGLFWIAKEKQGNKEEDDL